MRATWICHKIQSRLWELVEGKLDVVETRRMQMHLGRCPVCHAEWERVRLTVPLIVSLRGQPMPGSTTDFADVVRRIDLRQDQRSQPGVRLRYVSAACAVAAIALYMGTMRQMKPDTTPNVSAVRPAGGNHAALWVHAKAFTPSLSASRTVEPPALLGSQRPIKTAAIPRRMPDITLRTRYGAQDKHSVRATLWRLGERRRHSAPETPRRPDRAAISPDQSAALVRSADRSVEIDGVAARLREPARTFVMPAMGQDDGPRRTFIIDNIPNTTSAGQVGTAAATQNSETGRAL